MHYIDYNSEVIQILINTSHLLIYILKVIQTLIKLNT